MIQSFRGSVSVQSLSHVRLVATPWTVARQASLFISNSQSLLKLMSIESVMPSNHLILCHPGSLLPSIFPSIRVFSNESVLHTRWSKFWSFSFSISPSSEYSELISFRIDWFDLLAVQSLSICHTGVQEMETCELVFPTPTPLQAFLVSLSFTLLCFADFAVLPSILQIEDL